MKKNNDNNRIKFLLLCNIKTINVTNFCSGL